MRRSFREHATLTAVLDLAPVTLGPFVLAGDRAFVALTLAAALLVAEILGRRNGDDVEWAWLGVFAGLLAARLGFVALNLDAFLVRPQEVLYFWQGGFTAWIGVIVGALTSFWVARRRGVALARLRWPALAATIAAAVALLFLPAAVSPSNLQVMPVSLSKLDGAEADVASWMGTPTVVNLWATWCGPCRRELPLLIEEAAGRSDVRLVLASQGEAAGTVRAYMEQRDLPTEDVFLDVGASLQRATQAVGLPTTLFVNAEGDVVRVAFGELSRAVLREGIEAAQNAPASP